MLWSLALVSFLSNVNCLDFRIFNGYLNKNNRSSSKECLYQKELFLNALGNKTEWAISSE